MDELDRTLQRSKQAELAAEELADIIEEYWDRIGMPEEERSGRLRDMEEIVERLRPN